MQNYYHNYIRMKENRKKWRLMNDKVGLILEGGANRGIFTAGVLDFFKEHDIYLPYVVSVSVGTCNAIDYVSRQIGRTRDCMIPAGRNIPPISCRNLPKTGTIINLDMVFDEYPNGLVPFDYAEYKNSNIVSEYVVTNCMTGKAEYLSETTDGKRLMNICRASCSMPYIMPEVTLDGKCYLDGGISDPIPIKHAIELGYDKNIVVLTRNRSGIRGEDKRSLKLLSRMMYRRYPKLVMQLDKRIKEYNRRIRYIDRLEKGGHVLVIRPEAVMAKTMDNNERRLNNFYRHGYELAESRYNEILEFIS
jgi:predicted patatin/cPLA2 family phospholipase